MLTLESNLFYTIPSQKKVYQRNWCFHLQWGAATNPWPMQHVCTKQILLQTSGNLDSPFTTPKFHLQRHDLGERQHCRPLSNSREMVCPHWLHFAESHVAWHILVMRNPYPQLWVNGRFGWVNSTYKRWPTQYSKKKLHLFNILNWNWRWDFSRTANHRVLSLQSLIVSYLAQSSKMLAFNIEVHLVTIWLSYENTEHATALLLKTASRPEITSKTWWGKYEMLYEEYITG